MTRRTTAFRAALCAGALSVALSAPVTSSAFEFLGLEWPGGVASYRINPNFPDLELSGDVDRQEEILRTSAVAWRTQTAADFEFVYEGRTTRKGFNLSDGVNVISFVDQNQPDALAATLIDGVGTRATAFDIVFFASTGGGPNRWNGPQDPSSGTIDITGVAVHELGHAVGLDHTPIQLATMYAAARNRGLPLRTLYGDDIDGAEALYGTRTNDVDMEPSVISLEPPVGSPSGGNRVEVVGRNFSWTADTRLFVGGTEIPRTSFEVVSLERIVIEAMPPHDPGFVSVRVVNELGDTTEPEAYEYGQVPPRITAIEPDVGPVAGDITVTVMGSDFAPGLVVTVDGKPLEDVQLVDSETVTGVLPAAEAAGAVDVGISYEGETDVLPEAFTYTAKVLAVGKGLGGPGETGAPVPVFASTDTALKGFSFGLLYPSDEITMDDITVEGTVTEGADFAAANIDNTAGVTTFGLLMDYVAPEPNIPVGEDLHVATLLVSVNPSVEVGREIPLQLASGAGQPPINLIFNPLGQSSGETPFPRNGSVEVIRSTYLRGDVNLDNIVEMADPIAHLEFLFKGGAPIECDDAADANDDGFADISDAVYTLLFLFAGGPPPPPPYPLLGLDLTEDELGCDLP